MAAQQICRKKLFKWFVALKVKISLRQLPMVIVMLSAKYKHVNIGKHNDVKKISIQNHVESM